VPRILHPPAAVALLALLLPACDTVGDGSAFTATLDGAVDGRLEGIATFGPVGGDRFQLLLRLDEGDSEGFRGSIGFSRDGTRRPRTGTYPISRGEPDAFDVTIVLLDDEGAIALEARSGTLTVTGSSEDLLEGEFAFEAETPFGGGETEVEGTFTAVPE
jgi:hypothetical protein